MTSGVRRCPQVSGHGEKFSRKRELAIISLLSNDTIPTAAHHCGVSERTLRRWMHQPDFQERYRLAKAQLIESALSRLQGSLSAAADTLARNLSSGNPGVETRSAQLVFELVFKGNEQGALLARIEILEELLSNEPKNEDSNFRTGHGVAPRTAIRRV